MEQGEDGWKSSCVSVPTGAKQALGFALGSPSVGLLSLTNDGEESSRRLPCVLQMKCWMLSAFPLPMAECRPMLFAKQECRWQRN